MSKERPKTVVFGLDGAHFELLEPWIADGKLPNVEQAIKEGVSTDLHSVLPPVTSPNWKSYATGKNPGKFGIFWWENIDIDQRRIYYPSDRKNVEAEYWEVLSEIDDERPGVLGVPTTYPPKEVDEFVVSGAPDSENTGYTYPASLEHRLREEYDYQVTTKNELRATPNAAADEILDLIDIRFNVAHDLFEEYNLTFLQVTTFYINSLHHYFWDHKYTLQGWQIIDKHLGKFLDEGFDVVLMSDHGANQIECTFNINTWLEREGYLELDAGVAEFVHGLGINRDRLLRLASIIGLQDLAVRLTPQRIRDMIPDEQGQLIHESKASNIDWEKTDAVASGQGPLYITHNRNSSEYDDIREELREKLLSVKGPRGEAIVADVYRGEEVYSGQYSNEAPDLVIDQGSGIHIPGGIGRDEIFSRPEEDGWRGENKREGLFVATGPSFTQGETEPLSILDLAPTLLHLRGCSVPTDMDGEVRTDIFAEESDPDRRKPTYRQVDMKMAEKRRIRQAANQISLS
ncbi:alkaline phosphatase family protein [Natronomonas gomsonensis]|uniref:alkaline phosphatase family protein n=1 Tax=Natronomonas gomsonensis TaxID=1046043 RepID=UPI0015BB92BE|nr:alkaline phosphatase family protein [Natronomonas gomsonensis]